MTRIFLKLYLLLLLPLIIMAMIPKSPLSMLGEWWMEKESYRQYGAIYPLVKEELDQIPKAQWVDKVNTIAKQFAYPLLLKKRQQSSLKEEVYAKLDKKGFALINYKGSSTLVFAVKNSDFILYASLYSKASNLDEFEKDTRGFRYFLNKKIRESQTPLQDFERIKHYFSIKLKMYEIKEFKKLHNNKNLIDTLLKKKLFVDYNKTNLAYLLSEDKKYIVVITGVNSKATYRRYYQYLSFFVPALLLALGVLIWIALFHREFIKLNKTARTFGDGQLDARIQLSKNSALYPIAGSFNDMASRIQALLEGHKDLTNAVSHELKTPLSRLNFALEMQKTSKTEKERDIYTGKIEQNIAALENLVDELLGYTRMQRQQATQLKSHPLKSWLQNEIEVFSDYHPKIEISTDIQVRQNILFDTHLLSRALNNLLNNAVEYSTSDSPRIKVSAKQEEEKVKLVVEDNGIGIKQKDCQKIFEPFTRLDKSRQRKSNQSLGGYGMGLAIVKSIMQQHNGDVSCEKSSLGGAKICLFWPARSI